MAVHVNAIGLATVCLPSDHTSRPNADVPDGCDLDLFFSPADVNASSSGSTFTSTPSAAAPPATAAVDTLYFPAPPTLVSVRVCVTVVAADDAPPPSPLAVENATANDG
nr:unnamed protein product [Digitaria exilis]